VGWYIVGFSAIRGADGSELYRDDIRRTRAHIRIFTLANLAVIDDIAITQTLLANTTRLDSNSPPPPS
jgi:hypothetical protein